MLGSDYHLVQLLLYNYLLLLNKDQEIKVFKRMRDESVEKTAFVTQ